MTRRPSVFLCIQAVRVAAPSMLGYGHEEEANPGPPVTVCILPVVTKPYHGDDNKKGGALCQLQKYRNR